MGLGSTGVVKLAVARDKARQLREALAEGHDPLDAAAAHRKVLAPPTFGALADELIASLEEGWRNPKHRAQWKMTMQHYAAPLRTLPVNQVDTDAVLAILRPIWQAKPETASRVRGRIEKVLDYAKAKQFRTGENPAAWRGHLALMLPKRKLLSRGHHAAMPPESVPAFMKRLRLLESVSALALEFIILTCARTGEVLRSVRDGKVMGARWDEIDFEGKIWTVPAIRMKAGREHRVPLSSRAMSILESIKTARTGDFIFASAQGDAPLSEGAAEMLMRRMEAKPFTVHGFRSSFRDWAGNSTEFPRELAEHALAHVIGDKAEQAYRRGDALERRRQIMEAWSAHCCYENPSKT